MLGSLSAISPFLRNESISGLAICYLYFNTAIKLKIIFLYEILHIIYKYQKSKKSKVLNTLK